MSKGRFFLVLEQGKKLNVPKCVLVTSFVIHSFSPTKSACLSLSQDSNHSIIGPISYPSTPSSSSNHALPLPTGKFSPRPFSTHQHIQVCLIHKNWITLYIWFYSLSFPFKYTGCLLLSIHMILLQSSANSFTVQVFHHATIQTYHNILRQFPTCEQRRCY